MNCINRLVSFAILSLFSCLPALGHDHLKTGYVPWGVDEYELFGLTKQQLSTNFKHKLHFDDNFACAYIERETTGPQFLLSFDKGKVVKVQRMFIDGMGCHIMGPVLNSRDEALKFDGIKPPSQGRAGEVKKSEAAKVPLRKLKSGSKALKPQKQL